MVKGKAETLWHVPFHREGTGYIALARIKCSTAFQQIQENWKEL